MYKVFFLIGSAQKVLSVRLHSKSLRKSSKCQNFLTSSHLELFGRNQWKKPPCIWCNATAAISVHCNWLPRQEVHSQSGGCLQLSSDCLLASVVAGRLAAAAFLRFLISILPLFASILTAVLNPDDPANDSNEKYTSQSFQKDRSESDKVLAF